MPNKKITPTLLPNTKKAEVTTLPNSKVPKAIKYTGPRSAVTETPDEVAQRIQRENAYKPEEFKASQKVLAEKWANRKETEKRLMAEQEQPIETPVVKQPTQQNVADLLRQQSQSATDSLVAQLKQRISESVANQQQLISQAPSIYDPMRATSEVAKSKQLRSALERSSVLGDRGGIGRSEALLTQTEGDKRLSNINLDQQRYINDANQEIARLENEGKFEEARIVAEQKNKLVQNLIGETVRQEGIQREDELLARDEAIRQEDIQREEEQSQLDYERERAELEESREYDDYLRQVEKADKAELMQEEARIQEERDRLLAELDEATSQRDYERKKSLNSQLAAADVKLEAVKQANRLELEAERTAGNLAEIEAKGTEEEKTEPQYSDSEIDSAIKNAIGPTDYTTPEEQRKIMNDWIVRNIKNITGDQLDNIAFTRGITEKELEYIYNQVRLRSGTSTNPSPAGQ